MIDRKQRWTLWVMLIAMLIAFVGVLVYTSVNSTLGYGIVIVGVIVMSAGIAANIALSISRHNKDKQ